MLFGCSRRIVEPQETLEQSRMPVTGFDASYSAVTDRVTLKWNRPGWFVNGNEFNGYRIYRTTTIDTNSQPDSITFVSVGALMFIAPGDTSFLDNYGLEATTYYYKIRAFKANGRDTLFGEWSQVAYNETGNSVTFNINNGDLFTATPQCSLIINDPAGKVKEVSFCQKWTTSLKRDTTTRTFPWFFPDSIVDPALITSQSVANCISLGLISSEAKSLGGGVTSVQTPDFSSADPGNSFWQSTYQISQGRNAFAWKLKLGNGIKGQKKVFCCIVYKDGTTKRDTLSDEIGITPYKIELKFRNKTKGSTKSMAQSISGTEFTFYRPQIDYSVYAYGDTTFEQQFSVWIMVSNSDASVFQSQKNDSILETKYRQEYLEGIGPTQNYQKIYTYQLNTATLEGSINLSQLRKNFGRPYAGSPVPLRGQSFFNEYAIEGSYWGAQPQRYDTIIKSTSTLQPIGEKTPQENFQQLLKLKNISSGRKMFAMVGLFKGSKFKDTRTIVASAISKGRDTKGNDIIYPYLDRETSGETETFIDFYPPVAQHDPTNNPNFLTTDSLITGPFSYGLGQSPSIVDNGKARVDSVFLYIAQLPDNFTKDSVSNLTRERMISFRHKSLLYPIISTKNVLSKVKWGPIDPSAWATGEYIMGLYVMDEFGNKGWANISNGNNSFVNPWTVNIITGQ